MGYRAELWGSHKDLGNDDCWTTGDERATPEEARSDLAGLKALQDRPSGGSGWAYACVEGSEGRRFEEVNPKQGKRMEDDADARSEFAMQQGMGHGVEAFNEAMGQDVEDEPPSPGMR